MSPLFFTHRLPLAVFHFGHLVTSLPVHSWEEVRTHADLQLQGKKPKNRRIFFFFCREVYSAVNAYRASRPKAKVRM